MCLSLLYMLLLSGDGDVVVDLNYVSAGSLFFLSPIIFLVTHCYFISLAEDRIMRKKEIALIGWLMWTRFLLL